MTLKELEESETGLAFTALQSLHPALEHEEAFVRRVNDTLRPEGYRLVGILTNEQPRAVAVAGFRIAHSLAWGRYLYVDDLST